MPKARWNQSEIESLIHQVVSERKILPQLTIPGKSVAALNNQRRRLKHSGALNGAFRGRPVRIWTFPELKQLTALTADYGFSAAFIVQLQLLPGRSKDSVGKMMGRHGLGNAVIKARARQASRLSPSKRQELKQFLQAEGLAMSAREVAEKWGLAQKTINGYRRQIGIPLSWQEARSSPQYRAKQKQRARKVRQQMRERWRQWRSAREQKLRRLKVQLEQSPSPPLRRVCQSCREEWFAIKAFYGVQTHRLGQRIKISMSRTCHLCRSAQRRRQSVHAAAAA